MGILKQRKQTLSIRKISETIGYANKEADKRITKLDKSKELCSCHTCKSKEHVTYTGTNKGRKKFVCRNHRKPIWFSTSTSFEAIKIYQDVLVDNLCLLVQTNSTVGGIQGYNETSKYFVELALECLYEFINSQANQPIIEINENQDTLAIFLDISGSRLAKNKAIILAKVDDQIIFQIITTSNHLSSHEIISTIKKRLKVSTKTKVVFVTDGEKCFVGPIKHYFPYSIHIRQFHKRSCKGIIYLHFKHEDKDYTIRCLWDVVLNEAEPSKEVVRHRELKAKKRLAEKERKINVRYSELSKEVMIWEGTIYEPRGVRRLITKIAKKAKSNPKREKNTSTLDTQKPIFRGSFGEAKKLLLFQSCFKILNELFAGLYITSNIVETIFNVKSKFYPHRTMKFGKRMMVCILYCHTILKDKTKQELREFFKEKVITYDFIMQNVLCGSGLQKNKLEEPSFIDVIRKAFKSGTDLIIHYCDGNNKHTSRFITPLKIKENKYDGTTQIESFCHLRKEKRTFYLERIRDAAIYNQEAICF